MAFVRYVAGALLITLAVLKVLALLMSLFVGDGMPAVRFLKQCVYAGVAGFGGVALLRSGQGQKPESDEPV
jgi:hypothetical protein